MDLRQVLPAGTVLDGKYRIERVIGAGGFGITYAATDIGLNTTVALKEYYPGDFGTRDHSMSVRPKSDKERDIFDRLRQSFLREARTLAQFRHPSIVRVLSVFESLGTAFMIMEYEEGLSLKSWLAGLDRRPTQAELDRIVPSILGALEVMHATNYLHRDIAPDNIIIRDNGTPVLLDFGAARRVMAEATSAMTGVVKHGYSPQEQYSTDSKLQGPWTDIYAFGATLYNAVTGRSPPESTLRLLEEGTTSVRDLAGDDYRDTFLAGIDAAMAVRPKDRPQSVSELRAYLVDDRIPTRRSTQIGREEPNAWETTGPGINGTATGNPNAYARTTVIEKNQGGKAPGNWRAFALLASTVALGLGGYLVIDGLKDRNASRTTTTTQRVAERTTPPIEPPRETAPPAVISPPIRPLTPPGASIDSELQRGREAIEKDARDRAARPQVPADRLTRAEATHAEAVKLADGDGVARDYSRARQLFEQAAADGHADAARRLGWLYQNGLGVEKNYVTSRQWYQKAADAGNALAMNQIGWFHQNAFGVPENFVTAREWYLKGAAAGQSSSMFNLGWLYQHGRGVQKDLSKAFEWYRKSAEANNAGAIYQVGVFYQNGYGVGKDLQKAREWYLNAAAAGDLSAMNQVGWFYQNGLGVPVDNNRAREWYEKAAAEGHGTSMYNLAWLYQHGVGVARDYQRAREWYQKSSDAGNSGAMHQIGWFYQNGLGVAQDYTKAREYYEKAAKEGSGASFNQLGWIYQNGLGVAVDHAKSREWYEKGAKEGNSSSMHNLGLIYQNATGVPRDYGKALEWYQKGAAAGNGASMNQIGWFHQKAFGVPENMFTAREWYEKAATAQNGSGLWNLALFLDEAKGGPADYVRSAKLLLTASRVGHESAKKELGGNMRNWNRSTRQAAKAELKRLGLYNGSVDDVWDDAAKAAVNRLPPINN